MSCFMMPRYLLIMLFLLGLLTACSDQAGEEAISAADKRQGDKPPEPYLLDALWQGVDAGDWTLEEALLGHLRRLAEAGDVRQLYQGTPLEIEGLSGLFATARHYEAAGEAPQERREISKLLDQLLGSPEVLHALSASEPHSGAGLEPPIWNRLVGTAYAMSALCEQAVRNAYPTEVTAIGEPCFRYRQHDNRYGTHTLYYPARWAEDSDRRLAFVALAQQALDDALDAYATLGGMEPVDLVFTESLMGETYAFVDLGEFHRRESGDEYCLIHVLQYAYDELSDNDFRQAIAHEIFHCFQSWNFPSQKWGDGSGPRWAQITQWWVEGSAEYFSNVTYPENNFEWRNASNFDSKSPNTPLHQLSYENFLFFQHLSNHFGSRGIIEFLRTLPTSGDESRQADAIAGFRDMQRILREFGQNYLDMQIDDTGGGYVFTTPEPGEEFEIDATEYRFRTRPLVLYRAQLLFPGTGSRDVATEEYGASGRNRVKQDGVGDWREIPQRLGSGFSVCKAQEQRYQLLMTAAAEGDEQYRLHLKLEHAAGGSGDLEEADYRYRHFAGALEMLQSQGPDGLVPKEEYGASAEQSAYGEAVKTPLYCHMVCSLQCICDHPEFHSTRPLNLDECLEYVEGGRNILKTGPYKGRTECERRLEVWPPEGFSTIETWCSKRCSEGCGWPPG